MNVRRVSGVQVVHPLAHVNMVEGKIFKCEKIFYCYHCIEGVTSPPVLAPVSQAGREKPAGRESVRWRSYMGLNVP